MDFDLVLDVARLAKAWGARQCLVVSSLGADPASSIFYTRVKGEVEGALGGLGFQRLVLLRPALLLGDREESRPAEFIGQVAGRLGAPFLMGPLSRYRPVEAQAVAGAMLKTAAELETISGGAATVQVIESDAIQRIGH